MGKPVTHPYLPLSPSLQVHCGTPDKPATTKHFNPTGTWNLSKLCLKRKERKTPESYGCKTLCICLTKSFSPNTGCLHREITSILCQLRANIVSARRVTMNPINGARPLISHYLVFSPLISPLQKRQTSVTTTNKPWPSSSEACREQRRVRKALLSESAPLFPFQVNSWKWEMFEELFARDRLKRLQCLPCAAAFRGELMWSQKRKSDIIWGGQRSSFTNCSYFSSVFLLYIDRISDKI